MLLENQTICDDDFFTFASIWIYDKFVLFYSG
jgi:hypothetical protein